VAALARICPPGLTSRKVISHGPSMGRPKPFVGLGMWMVATFGISMSTS
jgi:hypothetical protein